MKQTPETTLGEIFCSISESLVPRVCPWRSPFQSCVLTEWRSAPHRGLVNDTLLRDKISGYKMCHQKLYVNKPRDGAGLLATASLTVFKSETRGLVREGPCKRGSLCAHKRHSLQTWPQFIHKQYRALERSAR